MSNDQRSSWDHGQPGGHEKPNEVKAEFDSAYTRPTPHRYLEEMAAHGYQIGEQARPYCLAAAELLLEGNGGAWPVQMLDAGCSYGMASAFVRYGCSFQELVAFFDSRAPMAYVPCVEATRNWLNATPPRSDIRVAGVDSSAPAIRFGLCSGLLDGGIARNFEEEGAEVSDEERAWFRGSNLLVSTGAVGYLTERTFSPILRDLGRDHPGDHSPLAVVTILRMFEPDSLVAAFEAAGFDLVRVPRVRLPQRAFVDEDEQRQILAVLRDRHEDVAGWESSGVLFADLYVGTHRHKIDAVVSRMLQVAQETDGDEPLFAAHTQVAQAGSSHCPNR